MNAVKLLQNENSNAYQKEKYRILRESLLHIPDPSIPVNTRKNDGVYLKQDTRKTEYWKTEPLFRPWQIAALIVGFLMLLFPIIADMYYTYEAENTIWEYTRTSDMSDEDLEERIKQAEAYNADLLGEDSGIAYIKPYSEQIVPGNSSAFAWLNLPVLSERLPIYHGATENSLQVGVGHVEGTSLPVGGAGTHAAFAGHSGMPGCRMFDDIDKMKIGDIFTIHVLNRTLAYKIYDKEVVLPEDAEHMAIEDNRDIVTLITCTPYGINDHRLLVHGERIEYMDNMEEASPSPVALFNIRTIPFLVGVGIVVLFVLLAILVNRRRKRDEGRLAGTTISKTR